MLAEPAGRALTLRDLEAQYLGLVLHTGRLADHLGRVVETVAYTGACRAITNRIPQSRVSVLAGLAAAGVGNATDGTEPVISIWTLNSDDEVTLDSVRAERVSRYWAHGWQIAVDAGLAARMRAMRDTRLPSETGGMLFGLVDIPAKSIHLVHASPAPPDSEERPGGFVRGTQGVEALMEKVGNGKQPGSCDMSASGIPIRRTPLRTQVLLTPARSTGSLRSWGWIPYRH